VSQLVSPASVATLAGRDDDAQFDGIASEAVEIISAMVASYCRLSFERVIGDTVVLEGGPSRRLILPNPPVTDVAAVAIDGTTIAADDYRWTRRGLLFRQAGWGAEASAVTATYDHGFTAVPSDIAAVTRTAALRLTSNPDQLARTLVEDFEVWHAYPAGFTIAELMTLNRYRRRSFP
jgi:hypothetical protein